MKRVCIILAVSYLLSACHWARNTKEFVAERIVSDKPVNEFLTNKRIVPGNPNFIDELEQTRQKRAAYYQHLAGGQSTYRTEPVWSPPTDGSY